MSWGLTSLSLAAILSTGVEIPEGGVPTNEGGHQYTTRTEKRPATITDEAAYLKWKWRMDLANPKTGLDNDAARRIGTTSLPVASTFLWTMSRSASRSMTASRRSPRGIAIAVR